MLILGVKVHGELSLISVSIDFRVCKFVLYRLIYTINTFVWLHENSQYTYGDNSHEKVVRFRSYCYGNETSRKQTDKQNLFLRVLQRVRLELGDQSSLEGEESADSSTLMSVYSDGDEGPNEKLY